jgi:RHS repeat-associated protein
VSGTELLDYRYDGRGFLDEAYTPAHDDPPPCPVVTDAVFCDDYETSDFSCWSEVIGGTPGGQCPWQGVQDRVEPTYSLEGVLQALDRFEGSASERKVMLYFGDRPAAIWSKSGTSAPSLTYLTTDHLGTAVFAMNSAGSSSWIGGFEPFGRDWQEGTSNDALAKGIGLRLLGQWDDAIFENSTLGAEQYYNLNRWYESPTSRYSGPDPISASLNQYAYVDGRPMYLVDPMGLLALDPSCQGFGDSGSGQCCTPKLADAVREFNDLFTPGWRQRKPNCWRHLSGLHRRPGWEAPRGGQEDLSPYSCMATGHRDQTIKCDSSFRNELGMGNGGCGITSDDGQTYFRPEVCNEGKCGSPLSTLFHEMLHRCGSPPHHFGTSKDDEVVLACVGP